MVDSAIRKNKLNQRRAELISKTSLEILKQKKITEASKIGGRFFSKRFVSLSLDAALRGEQTFLVVVKSVNIAADCSETLINLVENRSCIASVLSIKNIRTLYTSLSGDAKLAWLIPHLASHSTYLLVAYTFENYLDVLRACIRAEAQTSSEFLEILFVKEAKHFINFTVSHDNTDALSLRKLYTERSFNTILLELNSCISNIPLTFTGIFSISLLNSPGAIYPVKL